MKFSIITVFILFTYQIQSFTQSQIEKGFGMRYKYEGELLKPGEIKKLIISSGDSVAMNYYENYRTANGIGAGTMLVGVVILYVGGYQMFKCEDCEAQSVENLIVGGFILVIVGPVIGFVAAPISLRNAVNRYNSLQEQTKLELGITQNGVGLIYKF